MSAHLVSVCVVCQSQTDAFLCGDDRTLSGCLGELLRWFGDTAWLVEQMDIVEAKLSRTGGGSVGFVSSGGGAQPAPVDLGVMELSLRLRDHLFSWARELWETHAPRNDDGSVNPVVVEPTAVGVSRWLMRHPTWIKLHPAADELYKELGEDYRDARRAIDCASGKVYVGQCTTLIEGEICLEDVYAREGSYFATCRTCGTGHSVDVRRQVLLTAMEDQVVHAGLMAGLVSHLGVTMASSTIRTYAHKGKIFAVSEDDRGRPLYRVGDVLDVFLGRNKVA